MEYYEEQYHKILEKFYQDIDQTEMVKLMFSLRDRGISFKSRTMQNGIQIYNPAEKWDVICHAYSNGHEIGLLEIRAGFVDTEDNLFVGDADQILEIFDKWKKEKRNNA